MNILELFAHIGLKADTGPAETFGKSINGIKTSLVGAIAGTLSLAAAIRTVNDQFEQSLNMKKFADDTGESVEEMQKWKAVAQQTSGAGAAVAESIRAISSNQAKIRLGQGNISGYQLLGIDSRSDPFKVLEAIRAKTQGLPQSMRRNIASQFGISNDLVATLELTNEEFEKMAANAFVIPSENVEAMNKARSSFETVKNAANFLAAKFVTALAPSIENFSKKVSEFVKNYGRQLITWLEYGIRTITRVVDLIDKTIRQTIGWKTALIALAAVFIALNSAIMLPVAAIALLFIALEDIAAYSRGEDSLIGRYLKGMPALKKAFDGLLGTFKTVLETVKALFDAIFSGDFSKLDELTKKWGVFGDVLQVVAHALEIIKQGLSPKSIDESLKGIEKKGFWKEFADEWGNFANIITGTNWTGNDKEPKDSGNDKEPKKQKNTMNFPSSKENQETAKKNLSVITEKLSAGFNLSAIGGEIKNWFSPIKIPQYEPASISYTSAPKITITGSASPEATGKAVGEYIGKENQRAYDRLAGEKKEK